MAASWDVCEARRGIYEIRPLLDIMKKVGASYKHPPFIAGGFARWVMSPLSQPKPTNDIDIFSPNAECATKLVDACCASGLVENGSFYRSLAGWHSDAADTLPWSISICNPDIPVKVKVWYGTPEEVVSHFDFSVVRVTLTVNEDGICDTRFMSDERELRITVCAVDYPVFLIDRIAKYVHKGYVLHTTELLKVAQLLSHITKAERDEIDRILADMSHVRSKPRKTGDMYNSGELYALLSSSSYRSCS